jgi:hypothetical protein
MERERLGGSLQEKSPGLWRAWSGSSYVFEVTVMRLGIVRFCHMNCDGHGGELSAEATSEEVNDDREFQEVH